MTRASMWCYFNPTPRWPGLALGPAPSEKNLKVELWPEENRFELQAKNAEGTKKDHVTVRYVQRPVQVVIDSLVAPKAGGREFKPEILTNNRAKFSEPLPSSWVVLKGRVIWDSASAHKKFENADLLVRVNGTLCSKLKLVPQLDNELEDRFETGVRLATPTSHVKVDLAGVPAESIAAGDFTVTCEAKDHWERLHLLVIGVGPYKADQLRDQALSAFKGRLVDQLHRSVQESGLPGRRIPLWSPCRRSSTAEPRPEPPCEDSGGPHQARNQLG